MSVPATALSASELLDAAAAASGVSRERDERRFHAAKREIVLALERESVLLAGRDGAPLCEPGPLGGVLVAFTDDEAGRAWLECRHPAAPDCELTATAPALGRKGWLGIFSELGASSVAVNPSGPLGCAVHADEVEEMRPSLRRRPRGVTGVAHPWRDLEARAAERARVRQLLSALEAAVASDERAAWERLTPELPEANRFGALLVAAELQVCSGRRRVADGSVEDGLYQMIYGSFAWARFGDPYRATDGLLDAGSILDEPGGEPWRPGYRSELATVLGRIRTGYRTRDVDRVLSGRGEE